MHIPIQLIVFISFSVVLVSASFMVVLVKNPVRSALFLVAAFFASSVLWMMAQAEFLSLALIFVYVGAVMTLFLFVIMMINPEKATIKAKFIRYMPLAIIMMLLLFAMIVVVVSPAHFSNAKTLIDAVPKHYSNVTVMGELLFTRYIYPFEIAALILLVAIIAAISLAFFGRKAGTKAQQIAKQHQADKASRLRIISMETKKHDTP